jgi:hypothetical protein
MRRFQKTGMDRRVKQTSAVFQDHYQHEQLRTCRERGITVCILLNSPLQQKQLYDSSKMFQCPHQTQWPHSFITTKQSDKNPTILMHCNTFASSSRHRFEGLPDPNGQPSRRQEKRAACQSNRYKAFSSLPLPLSLLLFLSSRAGEPHEPAPRSCVCLHRHSPTETCRISTSQHRASNLGPRAQHSRCVACHHVFMTCKASYTLWPCRFQEDQLTATIDRSLHPLFIDVLASLQGLREDFRVLDML